MIKTWFVAIGRIVLVAGLLVLSALYFFQEKLIFPGAALPSDYHFQFQVPFEEKILAKGVDSILFRPPGGGQSLILYFHGNAGNLESWGQAGQELAQQTGINIWMVDYPGYGKSEGSINSEEQLHEMAAAFFASAEKLFPSDHIVIYGRSIGTGIAAKLASEHKVAALILESPYFSLQSLVQEKMSWVPLFLLKYRFRSDQWMPNVHSPVLIFHGDSDEVIPFAQGQKLSTLRPATLFVPIAGGHHNDLSTSPEYWAALKKSLHGQVGTEPSARVMSN